MISAAVFPPPAESHRPLAQSNAFNIWLVVILFCDYSLNVVTLRLFRTIGILFQETHKSILELREAIHGFQGSCNNTPMVL